MKAHAAIALVSASVFGFIAFAGLVTLVPGLVWFVLSQTEGEIGLCLLVLIVGWKGLAATFAWWGS